MYHVKAWHDGLGWCGVRTDTSENGTYADPTEATAAALRLQAKGSAWMKSTPQNDRRVSVWKYASPLNVHPVAGDVKVWGSP